MKSNVLRTLSIFIAMTIAPAAQPAQTQFASKPEFSALFVQLAKADAIVEGAKNPQRTLYVLFDANCFYCQLTWKALKPYQAAGLQVRWVPVAYQQASSTGRAAAIMQASDRVAALRVNETNYDAAHYDGGIKPLERVAPELAARFVANTQLMQKFGAPGTPALVWKDEKGVVRVKVGMPRLSELPAITGLPYQTINDGELANFK
jgi:thiol:disulfide interchange protein DsbG